MRNPWLKKNPAMSAWLSGANAVASVGRGQAAAGMQRQSALAMRQFTSAIWEAWLGTLTPPTARRRRR